jgi:hypothetical protein
MKENDAYKAGFIAGLREGRTEGWRDHATYLLERQEAYGRSWFGLPIMIIGAALLGWSALMVALSGVNILLSSNLALVITVGFAFLVGGLIHYRNEREEYSRKIDAFNARWTGEARQQRGEARLVTSSLTTEAPSKAANDKPAARLLQAAQG